MLLYTFASTKVQLLTLSIFADLISNHLKCSVLKCPHGFRILQIEESGSIWSPLINLNKCNILWRPFQRACDKVVDPKAQLKVLLDMLMDHIKNLQVKLLISALVCEVCWPSTAFIVSINCILLRNVVSGGERVFQTSLKWSILNHGSKMNQTRKY